MARRLELEYVADVSGFTAGSRKVEESLTRVDKATDKSSDKVRGGFSKASAAVAGFAGGVAANLAGNALGAVVGFAQQSITAASDMQETLSKSRAIFGDQAKAVEQWASGGAKNFGLAKSEALGYAASLGDMSRQIGFTGKESAAFGQDIVQVAADLGSFNNLETDDVLDKISGALRGEFDSLQAIIPNINAARVEQEALTLSGKKAAKELTAQDKALAVQAILHKDGARAMGDFAKTSGGFANQQKIAAAQVQTLQEQLGQNLLPILATVMGFVTNTAVPALIEFATWAGENLAPAIKDFAGSLSGVVPVVQSFGGFLAQNAKVILPLAGIVLAVVAAVKVWTAVQAALNVVMAANPIGLVVIAIGALVAGLIYAYQNSEDFRRIVDTAFKVVRIAVETAIGAVTKALSAVGDWLTKTWKTAVDFGVRVVRAFQQTNQRVINFIRALQKGVVDGVTTMRDRAVAFVLSLRDRFIRANQALRDGAVRAITQTRDRVVSFVTSLRDRAVAYVINLRDRFIKANQALRDGAVRAITQTRDRIVGYVTSMRDRAMAFVISLRDRAVTAVRGLRDNASKAAYQLRDRVMSPFRSLYDRAVDLFGNLKKGIGRAFGGLLDGIKGPVNTAFRWLNRNLLRPLNSVTSKFGLNVPDLPTFHKGGYVGGHGEVPAVLLAGEGVLSRRDMARIGGRSGFDRLREGMGGPGDWWNNFTEFISKPAQLVAKMAEQGVKFVMAQILGAVPNLPTSGVPMADVIPGILNAAKASMLSWATKREAEQSTDVSGNTGGSIGSGPWVKPVAAGIGNGYLGYPGHYGVDMPVGTGTPVHAVSNAVVTKAASLTYSYGKHLFLRHADGLVTVYAHLSQLLAHAGQNVRTGAVIGRSGSTGNSSGPHLHFETRPGGGYPGPNPRTVMRARGVTLDSGGMLPTGLTLVRNATGGPEPVLNPQQWAAIRNGASSRPTVIINLNGVIDKVSAAREIRAILRDDNVRLTGVTIGRPRA